MYFYMVTFQTVYMSQPPGFTHPEFPSHICKLQKALYGLKQGPCAWFSRLNSRLLELKFHASRSDTSLFIFWQGSLTLYILVYVDDIIITDSNLDAISKLISTLGHAFPVKDLGLLSLFLGLKVYRSPDGLILSQHKYIVDLLRRAGMSSSKLIASPSATSSQLFSSLGHPFDDPTTYCSLVGNLQYLSFTRPDLTFVVNKVCQFMHAPHIPH